MIVESKFRAPWWLRNGHAQTIWGSVFRKIKFAVTTQQRLELDDGDFIDLEWLTNENIKADAPILLLLHGLEGSKDSNYIQSILNNTESNQWHIIVMHFRGCSEELNRLSRSYHSGETEDLQRVLEMLKNKHPSSTILTAGFSLGGNVLLKYLGERGNSSLIDFAAAISVPMLLNSASERLDKGFSKLYRNKLLKELKQKTRQKISQNLPEFSLTVTALEKITTFYDFDDQVTAALHGFKGANDYYQRSSSRQFLKTITKPTLILHSSDDPFMYADVIPIESELSSSVKLELSQEGGHVGFIYGTVPWKAKSYIDKRISKWFNKLLQEKL